MHISRSARGGSIPLLHTLLVSNLLAEACYLEKHHKQMAVYYLVKVFSAEFCHLSQDFAPFNQIPSSIMHGMKAPSSPEVHQPFSSKVDKERGNVPACNIET